MRNTSLIYIYISRMQSSVQTQWVELGREVPMQESKGTQFRLREGPRRVLVFRPLQTISNIIDGCHIKETRESFYQPLSPHSDQSLTCSGGSLLFKLRGFSLVLDKETGQAQGGRDSSSQDISISLWGDTRGLWIQSHLVLQHLLFNNIIGTVHD